MDPTLANSIQPSLLAAAAALWLASCIVLGRRAGMPVTALATWSVAVAAVALAGGKIGFLVARGTLGTIGEGYGSAGALVLLVLLSPLLTKLLPGGVSAARWADVAAPGTGAAIAVMRIECLLMGCCHGQRTDLPWSIRFPAASPAWLLHVGEGDLDATSPLSLAVHPLPAYFALAAIVTAALSARRLRTTRFGGEPALIFVALYGVSKWLLELLRDPTATVLPALELLTAAGAILMVACAWIAHLQPAGAAALTWMPRVRAIPPFGGVGIPCAPERRS